MTEVRKTLVFLFLSSILICCSKYNKVFPQDKGKRVMREKCMFCHSDYMQNTGPPFGYFYERLGAQQLKEYLVTEFHQKKYSVPDHKPVKLTKKEVDRIMIYLEVLNGVLPY